MNWLFWVLLVFTVLSVIRGGRKGFVRTAVSMVSLILVMVIAAWVNPYVGRFLRESTPVYQFVEKRSDKCRPHRNTARPLRMVRCYPV